MAKSGSTKVVFVPMQLQSSDMSSQQYAGGSGMNAILQSESGTDLASRAGVLNSVSEM